MERKIALKFENAFVKAQFFKLFAKIIVRLGLTIICPPPLSAYLKFNCFVGPQKFLQFQPKWHFLALKFETFCYYNCFLYPFLLGLTVSLAKSLKNWGILIRMAVILVETGCSLEKCMHFSLTGSKMLQFSNLKTTVQECQRRHKKIPPSEIKELHCNKVPLTRNYVRNYPFKSNIWLQILVLKGTQVQLGIEQITVWFSKDVISQINFLS